MDKIITVNGEYAFLSNFFLCPIFAEGTLEHASGCLGWQGLRSLAQFLLNGFPALNHEMGRPSGTIFYPNDKPFCRGSRKVWSGMKHKWIDRQC